MSDMTTPSPSQPVTQVSVIQADREAAANYMATVSAMQGKYDPVAMAFMDEAFDAMPIVQAFARHRHRHRLATSADQREALADIAAERLRQIEVEGWTPAHDDQHSDYSLAQAAATYAIGATVARIERGIMDDFGRPGTPYNVHHHWPWDDAWFKPTSRRADLVKAGALIVAEIERLDRSTSDA